MWKWRAGGERRKIDLKSNLRRWIPIPFWRLKGGHLLEILNLSGFFLCAWHFLIRAFGPVYLTNSLPISIKPCCVEFLRYWIGLFTLEFISCRRWNFHHLFLHLNLFCHTCLPPYSSPHTACCFLQWKIVAVLPHSLGTLDLGQYGYGQRKLSFLPHFINFPLLKKERWTVCIGNWFIQQRKHTYSGIQRPEFKIDWMQSTSNCVRFFRLAEKSIFIRSDI